MLTNSEKLWLKTRDSYEYFSCRYCPGLPYYGPFTPAHGRPCARWCFKQKERKACRLASYYEDSAEFEARVAAKLAEQCVLLEKVVQKALGAAEYINLSAAAENALKAARLQVEEEMDAN